MLLINLIVSKYIYLCQNRAALPLVPKGPKKKKETAVVDDNEESNQSKEAKQVYFLNLHPFLCLWVPLYFSFILVHIIRIENEQIVSQLLLQVKRK